MRQLAELESKLKESKADPEKLKRLEHLVNAKKIEYDKANDAASKLQDKVNAIAEEIEKRTTGKIKVINKKIEETTRIINECTSQITKFNVAIKTSIR